MTQSGHSAIYKATLAQVGPNSDEPEAAPAPAAKKRQGCHTIELLVENNRLGNVSHRTDETRQPMLGGRMKQLLIILVGIAALWSLQAIAADGVWKYELGPQEHPELTYTENGKEVFSVGCGHAFAVHANYPGAQDRKGAAAITIANSKTKMVLKGEIDEPEKGDPPGPARFTQWDLGYRRQNPALYGKKWHALEDRLFDLLDSKLLLTISAGKKDYVLPAVDAPDWKAKFRKIC